MRAGKPTSPTPDTKPDTIQIQNLVGDLLECHEVYTLRDGKRMHALRIDYMMSPEKADRVRDEIRVRLARGLPPDWEFLPGSVLIRSPRIMHVIVPMESSRQ